MPLCCHLCLLLCPCFLVLLWLPLYLCFFWSCWAGVFVLLFCASLLSSSWLSFRLLLCFSAVILCFFAVKFCAVKFFASLLLWLPLCPGFFTVLLWLSLGSCFFWSGWVDVHVLVCLDMVGGGSNFSLRVRHKSLAVARMVSNTWLWFSLIAVMVSLFAAMVWPLCIIWYCGHSLTDWPHSLALLLSYKVGLIAVSLESCAFVKVHHCH
ncbi:hypothetical protein U1Q18_013016, partial [Sarracenia purpurea var. burkii]